MAGHFSTPGGPAAPHTTPSSARSALRAPIHNPYDKFTQPEFDAWIGDITGALKRALGHVEPAPKPPKFSVRPSDVSDEEVGEDSFAEIKARRAAKGKQRATYEDLDEEELEAREVESSILVDSEGSEEDELEYEDNDAWEEANGNGRWTQSDEGSVEESDEDVDEQGDPDAPIEISDDEDDDAPTPFHAEREYDEEGSYEEEYDEEGEEGEVTILQDEEDEAHHELEQEEDDQEEAEDEEEAHSDDDVVEVVDDEDEEFPPREGSDTKSPPPVDIVDPWEGPSTYAEDFYSGGDVPFGAADAHLLPTEVYDVQDEDFIPEDENAVGDLPPVQLVDKWEGPRTFAEDFYSGGDLPRALASVRTPSHLTPAETPNPSHDDVVEFLTPGVLTPESQPAEAAMGSSERDEVETAEDVPTFSMPPESDDEGRQEGKSDEGIRESADMDELYGDLEDDPLPEAADVAPPTPALTDVADKADVLDLPLRPSQVSPKGHVDWNNPPAFPSGHRASGPGHLKSPPDTENHAAALPSPAHAVSTPPQEILEISDDEDEDEPETIGPLPLGTSDLEIPADAVYDDDEDVDADQGLPEGIQGLSEDFDSDIIEMFGNSPLNTDGIMESTPDGEDHVSFEDFASLYTNAEGLDALAESEDATQAEEPLEPVVAADTDFGDLPTPSGIARPDGSASAAVSDFFEVLSQVDHPDEPHGQPATDTEQELREVASHEDAVDETGGVRPPAKDETPEVIETVETVTVAEEYVVEETVEEAAEEADPVRPRSAFSDGVDVATDRGETPAARDYSIIEEVSDDEIVVERVREVTVEALEVTSDKGDSPAAAVEFNVEEAVTVGRRTEEPDESQHIREASFFVESVVGTPPDETEESSARPIEELQSEAVPEPVQEESLSEDVVAHPPTEATEGTGGPTDSAANETELAQLSAPPAEESSQVVDATPDRETTQAVPAIEVTTDAPQDSHSSDAPATDSALRMLEGGIPMPVSADPTVPDPASVHDSPSTSPGTTSPQMREAKLSSHNVLSAVPPALLQRLAKPASLSGLFTPFSDGGSGASSPVAQSTPEAVDEDEQEQVPAPVAGPSGTARAEDAEHPDHDPDMDADGDIDPDYVEAEHDESTVEAEQSALPSPTAAETVETTAVPESSLAQVESVDPEAPESDRVSPVPEPVPEASEPEREAEGPEAPPTDNADEPPQPEESAGPTEPVQDAPSEANVDASPSLETAEAKPETPAAEAPPPESVETSEPVAPVRASKRKRTPSVPPPPRRITRSLSQTSAPSLAPPTPKRPIKGKGKQKATMEEIAEENDGRSEAGSVDRATPEITNQPSSRIPSRESSVASTSPSNFSVFSPSSPIAPTVEHSRLAAAFQNDGFMRHHHGVPSIPSPVPPPPPPPPPAQPVEPAKPVVPAKPMEPAEPVEPAKPTEQRHSRSPSPPPADIAPAAVDEVPEPPVETPAEAPAVPAVAHKPPPSTHTPVTRSQCRFHKISMPRRQGRDHSRIYFVIPGCSLSNREVMKKRDIRDHGDVALDEIPRLRSNVESLSINLELIGVLRQLVGIDIEREAFYLPHPGERVRMRSSRTPAKPSNVESISARNGIAGATRTKKALNAVKSSPTNAESASASASPARSRFSVASSYGASISDGEGSDAESRPSKRRRKAKASSVAPEPAAAGTSASPADDKAGDNASDKAEDAPQKRQPTRRSKRLADDAQAYKPGEDTDGHSSEEEAPQPKSNRRRAPKGVTKGVKRPLTPDTTEGAQGAKKRKVAAAKNDAAATNGNEP